MNTSEINCFISLKKYAWSYFTCKLQLSSPCHARKKDKVFTIGTNVNGVKDLCFAFYLLYN